ncbi:MAG: globin [Planctomycetota bacterium]|nr:globin [Planctomycetota bacterium]
MSSDLTAEPTYHAVLESYYRCEKSEGCFGTFYELFFGKSSEIAPRFVDTDMERQKQIVGASLLWMLRLGRGDPITWQEVVKLAQSHSRQGHDIPPHLYSLWLDALCNAVERHDTEYTPELESQWRAIMEEGIDLIVSKYEPQKKQSSCETNSSFWLSL